MSDQPIPENGTPKREIVPAARVDDLVITEAGDELLVYDTKRHHIHHLNQTAALIWGMCDGRRTLGDLARAAMANTGQAADAEMVRLALTKLDDAHLLDHPLAVDLRIKSHATRRFTRRTAIGGAVALPVIASMTAPAAADTASNVIPASQCSPQVLGVRCYDSLNGYGHCGYASEYSSYPQCLWDN